MGSCSWGGAFPGLVGMGVGDWMRWVEEERRGHFPETSVFVQS